MPDFILALIAAASQFSGYPIPADATLRIQEVSLPELKELACPGHADKCSDRLQGLYKDDDIVYVLGDLTPIRKQADEFHEIVHWLQHHSGKFKTDYCPDDQMREAEAYHATNLYEMIVQHVQIIEKPPFVDCSQVRSKK